MGCKRNLQEAEEEKAMQEDDLRKQEDELDDLSREIQRLRSSKCDVGTNLPKLKKDMNMYYSIARITFDKKCGDGVFKGFVVNERKNDVHNFNFDTVKDGISMEFVTNFLWDLIGAGV